MKRIAIITPGLLPVPAVKGGAVETLITQIIEQNELNPCFELDIYTTSDPLLNTFSYKYTKLYESFYSLFFKFADRSLHKLLYIFHKRTTFRFRDILMVRTFQKINRTYDIILVENIMSLYQRLIKLPFSCPTPSFFFHMHNDIDKDRSVQTGEAMFYNGVVFITVSRYLANKLTESIHGLSPYVLLNAIPLRQFMSFDEKKVNLLRDTYQLTTNNLIFTFSGRTLPEKGVLELMSAFLQLSKENDKARLIIAGCPDFRKPQYKNAYYRKIQKLAAGMHGKVILTGFMEYKDMPSLLAISDVIVIPSIWEEPFGMVGLEAMACAKPVIAVRSGGLSEALDDSCTLFIENDGEVSSNLHAAMQKLSDKDLRRKMGNAGRSYIEAHKEFDTDFYFKNFVSILHSALEES